MTKTVDRILALGGGAALDDAARYLSREGYVVAQVTDPAHARHLLKEGDFSLVLAQGEVNGLTAMLRRHAPERPWLYLGKGGGEGLPPELGMRLELPLTRIRLLAEVAALLQANQAPGTRPRKGHGKGLKERTAGRLL